MEKKLISKKEKGGKMLKAKYSEEHIRQITIGWSTILWQVKSQSIISR